LEQTKSRVPLGEKSNTLAGRTNVAFVTELEEVAAVEDVG
jgi:hypothetical protein